MKLKYLFRVYASLFKWVPFSAGFTLFVFISNGFVPVIITYISAEFFDTAAAVLKGRAAGAQLFTYAFIFIGVYFIRDLLNWGISITNNAGVYEKGTAYFRINLFEKMARLPLINFEDPEFLNRRERAEKNVNNEALSSLFMRTAVFTGSFITVTGISAVLTRYSILLLPLCFVSVLPYIVMRIIRGREFYYTKYAQAKKTRLSDYLRTIFSTGRSAKELRVFGSAGYVFEKWRKTRDEVFDELWQIERKDAWSLVLCDTFRIACYAAAVGMVLFLAVRGRISVGAFGASIAAFLAVQQETRTFIEDLGRIPERLSYAEDYYSFLDIEEEKSRTVTFPGLRGEISLKNVGFSYPGTNTCALNRIDLSIRKGEKIALLGENGSGKTTLAKVLLGIYPPSGGRVLWDNTDIAEVDKNSLYAFVSAIAQDFSQYHLSIRENVALSDLSRLHDDASIGRALRNAGADNYGEPDTPLGREFGGLELSGGQWQRLAIARALFKNADFILLDEPTSALDPLVEADILKSFIRAAEGKTALIISHRIGLSRLVDRIVILKNGEIAETGAHNDLIKKSGEYSRLWKAQERWYR
jgi:ABC-type multidrug transport system fused ATPase/permease subunit